MAVKKVSISNLPVATRSEVDASLFMASTRAPGSTTMQSKQLSYGELYSKIISDVRTELGLNLAVGSDTKPIYVNSSKMFSASTKNIGGIANTADYGKTFTPIYMKNGELCASNINVGSCSYDGHTCTPIYMNNGALRPATSHIGSNTQPIYMDHGTLKASTYSSEAGVSLAANQTPIVMTNGKISKMQPSIGKNTNNDVLPVYVNAGRIASINSGVGNENNPIYINSSGHIVPGNAPLYELDFPPTGDENTPVYIDSDGQFQVAQILEHDKALITGNKYDLVATVLFTTAYDKLSALIVSIVSSPDDETAGNTYDDITSEFRLAYSGNRAPTPADGWPAAKIFNNKDTPNPVAFLIPVDGWYVVHVEAGNGGVGFAINTSKAKPGTNAFNNGWYHYHPYFTKKNGNRIKMPNLIYVDGTTRQSVCAMFHLMKDCVIGIYSNIKRNTAASANAKWSGYSWAEFASSAKPEKVLPIKNGKIKNVKLYESNQQILGIYPYANVGSKQYPFTLTLASTILRANDTETFINARKSGSHGEYLWYSYFYQTDSTKLQMAYITKSNSRYSFAYVDLSDTDTAGNLNRNDPKRKESCSGLNSFKKKTAYSVGAKVKYSLTAYKCIQAVANTNTTYPSKDPEHWEAQYVQLSAINQNAPWSKEYFTSTLNSDSLRREYYDNNRFAYVCNNTIRLIGAKDSSIDDIDYLDFATTDLWGNRDIVELFYVS